MMSYCKKVWTYILSINYATKTYKTKQNKTKSESRSRSVTKSNGMLSPYLKVYHSQNS